jgi:hypothetical protein
MTAAEDIGAANNVQQNKILLPGCHRGMHISTVRFHAQATLKMHNGLLG